MIEKNHVYNDSKDQHVAATFVYVKTAKAYADEACTVQLKTSELQDLFLKGAVIVDASVFYKPISLKIASGVATVTYAKTNTTTATQAELATAAAIAD